MRAESVQQRLAEVNSSHGKSKHCKRDGLEAAAAPDVDGNVLSWGVMTWEEKNFWFFRTWSSIPPLIQE